MPNIPAVAAKLLFQTAEFNAQLLRSLGKASVGGSDIGECFATAFQITDGNFESWYTHWKATADRIFKIAQDSESNAHYVSALSGYLRATEYYRQAEWFLRDNLADPRVVELGDRISDGFRKAIPFLPYYVVPVEIPYENDSFLYGYYCQFDLDKTPKATVLLPGGYDSFCEELFFTAVELLKRGYNVLIFDGPGQGHTVRKNKLYMRPDWENVIKPVIAYALNLPHVLPNKLVMMGRSLGGYLAARAATGEFQFSALICDPGQWDLFVMLRRLFPADALQAILNKKDEDINKTLFRQLFSDNNLRFYFQSRMAVHQVTNACEWIRMLQLYTLKDHVKNIQCPTLICAASAEDKSPGQAKILADAIGLRATLLEFTSEEGAGDHCEAAVPQLFSQRVFDWLDDQFK